MFNPLPTYWQNHYRRQFMDKFLKFFDVVIPWGMLISFGILTLVSFFVDYKEAGLYIAAAIGWASYLEMRSKYDKLENTVIRIAGNESQG